MIAMSVNEVAAVVSGIANDAAHAETLVTGPVCCDVREVVPGSLFVVVEGEEEYGGVAYAAAAIAAGAVAVMTDHLSELPAIVVGDVVQALGRLAAEIVARLPHTMVIAVTGSSGKTSTKDVAAHLLRRVGTTVATVETRNNLVGVPRTVSRAEADTRHLLLEVGAFGPGEIRHLTGLVAPQVGVVLNVGTAHLSSYGSLGAIAEEKGMLIAGLPGDGVAILNADDFRVRAMAHRTRARVVLTGHAADAEVRATGVCLDDTGRPRFMLATPEGRAPVALREFGLHQVSNALAAAAVARHAGLELPEIADALGSATVTSRWRMEVTERSDGVTIVNDAYNANPHSMRASLAAVRAMAGRRRTIAVLGAMREQGGRSAHEHARLGAFVGEAGITAVVTVGGREAEWMAHAVRTANGRVATVPDQEAALAHLGEFMRPGDVVLVKASRGENFQRLAEALADGKDAAEAISSS